MKASDQLVRQIVGRVQSKNRQQSFALPTDAAYARNVSGVLGHSILIPRKPLKVAPLRWSPINRSEQ